MEFTITNGIEVMKQFSRTDRIREILEKMPKASKKIYFFPILSITVMTLIQLVSALQLIHKSQRLWRQKNF